jgi:5-methylcytosine-specific restriction endonuclease McrA
MEYVRLEQSRVCPGCNANLPLSAFGKKSGPKARKDGTRSRCKSCESAAFRIYAKNNRDTINAAKRAWAEKNPDKKAAMDKRYREKYPDKVAAQQKRWALENKDHIREYKQNLPEEKKIAKRQADRIYGKLNRDVNLKATRKYRATHPDRIKEISKRWRDANPEAMALKAMKRRALKEQNGVYLIQAKELIKIYKSECFYCHSNTNIEADHIIPISRGGIHSVGNLIAACRKCNASKGAKTITEWKKWKRNYEL